MSHFSSPMAEMADRRNTLIPTRDEADSRGGFPNREKSESMGADDGGSGSWVLRSVYGAIMMGQR
jgi:hypothetical protein